MGHVVMHFERIAEVMTFYQEVLEFKLSDYWLRPFPAYFFHVNPRHHSIAFVETGKNMVHHMMVELYSFDDVGQGYDLALGDPEQDRASRSAAIPATTSPRSTPGTRRASWSSTAGAGR